MTSNVVFLKPYRDPNTVLEKAKDQYQDVMLIGWNKDDESLDWRSSNEITMEAAVYLLESLKLKIMNGEYSP